MVNEENNDTLQGELGDLVSQATTETKTVDPSDPRHENLVGDDDTLEVKKGELYSEKVIVTEQVQSKMTAGLTKVGISYGTAKAIWIVVGLIILGVAGWFYYDLYGSQTVAEQPLENFNESLNDLNE